MKLSNHFTLEEMTRSQTARRHNIDNSPDEAALYNLKRLATELEKVRELIQKPIVITSGLRVLELNRKLNSKDSSSHVVGCAADFIIHGLQPKEIVQIIKDSYIKPDQVIDEWNEWVHFSISKHSGDEPREMYLTIDDSGTREFQLT